MKKPNLQRLAQRSKIYLRKASPTILSGLGAAGVIVTSVLAVRATPKALRKIRADSNQRNRNYILYIWSECAEQTSTGSTNQCLCIIE